MSLLPIKKLFGKTQSASNLLFADDEGQLELDRDFVIRRVHGSILERLCGEAEPVGQPFAQMLRPHISEHAYTQIVPMMINLIEYQDILSFSVKNNPFDCLKIVGIGGRKVYHYLRFEFRKAEDYDNTGIWVIFIRDISETVKTSRKIRRTAQKAEIKMNTMMSLLQFEQDLIRDFLESTIESLKAILKNLRVEKPTQTEIRKRIEAIYAIVHQIKGDAAILNLDGISSKSHQFENLLTAFNAKKTPSETAFHHLARPLKSMIDSVKEIKEIFENIRENGWGNEAGFCDDSMKRRLEYLVGRVANDNNKRVLVIDAGYKDSYIPVHLRRVVGSVMTQLARNAVVHGIEDTQTRLGLKKTPYGCLHVSVESVKDHIKVTMRDDGCGVDPKKIKQAALKSPLFKQEHVLSWTDTQSLNALFKTGFSTQGSVSQHAGRGVGLSVIRNTVEKYGGKMAVRSSLGHFTEFVMSFPKTM